MGNSCEPHFKIQDKRSMIVEASTAGTNSSKNERN